MATKDSAPAKKAAPKKTATTAPKKAAAPKKETAPKKAATPKKEAAPKAAAAPKAKKYHVMVHPEFGWQVKAEGNSKATVRCKTKEEAEAKAKELSKPHGTKHVPHKKDGKIQKTKY